MTHARYTSETNELVELPTIPAPIPPTYESLGYSDAMLAMASYEKAVEKYNAHVSALRRVPCSDESCTALWKDGQELSEGVDYGIIDGKAHPIVLHNSITPKSENALKDDIDTVLVAYIDKDGRREAVNSIVRLLLEKYSLAVNNNTA